MVQLNINGKDHNIDVEPDMPLLWAIRELLGMTGTKYGCGIAACGACTVHVNGEPARSCSIPAAAMAGTKIITIEGLSANSSHPIQQAWAAVDVPQCGYCQSGQIMAAAALLKTTPKPTDADIDEQHLPLRHLSTHSRSDSLGCGQQNRCSSEWLHGRVHGFLRQGTFGRQGVSGVSSH
jgi:isoquinoline 1-oxidoreductase alpha subunit